MKSRTLHGYTLVEILVVIAIMGVLAAILFAAGRGAMEEARKSSCAASMGQLAKATLMYVDDYDGRYPSMEGVTFRTALAPYLKSSFPHCPSVVIDRAPFGYKGYAFNSYLIDDNMKVHDPSRTALIWERRTGLYVDGGVQPCNSYELGSLVWKDHGCEGPPWHDRHNGVGNVAFVDGHVKALAAAAFRNETKGHVGPGDPVVIPIDVL